MPTRTLAAPGARPPQEPDGTALEETETGRATREMLKHAGPLMIRAMLTHDLVDLLAAHEEMEQHPQAVHAFYRAMPEQLSAAIARTLPESVQAAMRVYASRRRQWPTEDPREAWNAIIELVAVYERMRANDHRGARAVWSTLEGLAAVPEANPLPVRPDPAQPPPEAPAVPIQTGALIDCPERAEEDGASAIGTGAGRAVGVAEWRRRQEALGAIAARVRMGCRARGGRRAPTGGPRCRERAGARRAFMLPTSKLMWENAARFFRLTSTPWDARATG